MEEPGFSPQQKAQPLNHSEPSRHVMTLIPITLTAPPPPHIGPGVTDTPVRFPGLTRQSPTGLHALTWGLWVPPLGVPPPTVKGLRTREAGSPEVGMGAESVDTQRAVPQACWRPCSGRGRSPPPRASGRRCLVTKDLECLPACLPACLRV